jgi:trimeric autotransporter adhesin
MKINNTSQTALLAAAALSGSLFLTACGGGGGGATPPPVIPVVTTTTPVTTTVIDGAIRNAVVCMDKNSNGLCDTGEVQGRTDATGKVTLAIPDAEVGKFPLLALVGTDSVDVDNGTVTVPFSMVAPASRSAVISPLTTLVQETIVTTGASPAEAERAVQSSTGITGSLFQDFTTAPAPTDGSPNPMKVARMVVVATQSQVSSLTSVVGSTAMDGAPITQADINRAVNQRLLQILPSIVAAVTSPANISLTGAALEAAVVREVSSSLLTTASVPTLVAINNQTTAAAATTTVAATTPTAGFTLVSLNFTDALNWVVRTFNSSVAQNTPDANGLVKFVEKRVRNNSGTVAQWGFGGDPGRNSDVHWNGSAWVACALNNENTATVRDAAGNNSSDYCDKYSTSKSSRATFDVSDKTMAQVYGDLRSAGYTNVTIADSLAKLGNTTFPTGSSVLYQTSTPLSSAIAYAVGLDRQVFNFSAQITAGGDGRTQAAGVGCNATEFSGRAPIQTTTLEQLVAAYKGTPCVFGGGSFVSNGVTYTNPDPTNEAWAAAVINIGDIGNVRGTPTAYYTGNTLIRVAFQGSGTNPLTYYSCKERFNNFSTRNCTSIGTGTYTISTLGDARVMTLSNPPSIANALNYTRTFIERGGKVFAGFEDKLTVSNTARLNTTAANALFTQLGMPTNDPSVAQALTAASYQGTWFVRGTTSTDPGVNLIIGANGVNSCQGAGTNSNLTGTGANEPCTLTITNPATGAFTVSFADGAQLLGTFNFITGAASGTFTDPTSTPTSGSFAGGRRL